jgi:hypothetical protein
MDSKQLVQVILPLLLIPLNLYAIQLFGQDAGNLIIGCAFFVGLVKFARGNERRFMIILVVFATVFESLNVVSGSYKYVGSPLVPFWIGLGWGVVGLYLVKLLPLLKKIEDRTAYSLSAILYPGLWAVTGMDLHAILPVVYAILGIFALTLSTAMPASFFLSAGLLGAVIELLGTSMGIWQYFDASGNPIPAQLPNLALAYASVIAFALWLSGIDAGKDSRRSGDLNLD